MYEYGRKNVNQRDAVNIELIFVLFSRTADCEFVCAFFSSILFFVNFIEISHFIVALTHTTNQIIIQLHQRLYDSKNSQNSYWMQCLNMCNIGMNLATESSTKTIAKETKILMSFQCTRESLHLCTALLHLTDWLRFRIVDRRIENPLKLNDNANDECMNEFNHKLI